MLWFFFNFFLCIFAFFLLTLYLFFTTENFLENLLLLEFIYGLIFLFFGFVCFLVPSFLGEYLMLLVLLLMLCEAVLGISVVVSLNKIQSRSIRQLNSLSG